MQAATCYYYDSTGSLVTYDCSDSSAIGYANSLSFSALAPIVLLHGIRADASSFDQVSLPLQLAGLPFKAITFDQGEPLGSDKVKTAIVQAAGQFGASHVHLVGHSKGGLWARAFLTKLPDNFGVYSLTTITTPHSGSVAADMIVALNKSSMFSRYDPDNILPPAGLGFLYKQSMDELTVASMQAFNMTNRLPTSTTAYNAPNTVHYYSLAADLNVDHSTDQEGFGTISCPPDDCSKLNPLGGNLPAPLVQYIYRKFRSTRASNLSSGLVIISSWEL